ncbi:MAG: hypothetical protein FGM46_02470 [Ferruginibacter sp.]|nr:hypothetical protein [Ferruginibacter sp.]
MKKATRDLGTCCLFFVGLITISMNSFAQITMSASGNYSQNFDALSNTGTTNPWVDNSTISNWYAQRSGTGTNYAADAGTSNAGNLYSYGSTGSTDRALGSVGSSNAAAGNFAYGVLLQNTSGGTITDIKVTYTLEQWRNSAAAQQGDTFYYKISSSPISALNPNSNSTWTMVAGLILNSPITGGTAGALDGNLPANRLTATSVSIPGLTLANNDYIMLKWDDRDQLSSDHGLAIDDVNIEWTVGTVSGPSLNASSLTSFGNICNNTTAGPNSFTVSGTALNAGNITVGPLSGYSFSSSSGGAYTSTLDIPQAGGTLSATTIFVKFSPTAIQSYNGNIPVSGGGANSINVAATGSGSALTTPAFTQPAPICSGSSYTLPTSSTNGITGTWAPVFDNTTTKEYTFTPGASQCAVSTKLTVDVVTQKTPIFTQIAPICLGGSFTLLSTSDNGVNGSWAPAIDVTQTKTYTFTPGSGECASTATMTVEVNTSGTDIVTGDSLSITRNSVVLRGNINAEGCSPVTAYGIEYSSFNAFANGTGIKIPSTNLNATLFSSKVTGLVQNTAYYYKAYAESDAGIKYGDAKLFFTKPIPAGLTIYSSPIVRGTPVRFSLSGIKQGHYAVRIFNTNAQQVYQKDIINQLDFIDDSFILPGKLPAGVYNLQIFCPDFKINKTFLAL